MSMISQAKTHTHTNTNSSIQLLLGDQLNQRHPVCLPANEVLPHFSSQSECGPLILTFGSVMTSARRVNR